MTQDWLETSGTPYTFNAMPALFRLMTDRQPHLGCRMKLRSSILLVLFAAMLLPQCAQANAGTPLMWAGMLHLVFGNFAIGVVEGLLLVWLFQAPMAKSLVVMVLANYASAWLGGLFIRGVIVNALSLDLNNGWRWFWIMVLATYCLTLMLEWPFIAWCFRRRPDWWKRSMLATLATQSASYVLLFGGYWMVSGTSLYTQMHVVAPADISLPKSVLVYFISPNDGNVYKRRLAGGEAQKVYDLHSTDKNDRLLVRPSAPDTARWDLVARLETADHNNPRLVTVQASLMADVALDWRSEQDPPQYKGSWFNFGEAPALGSSTASQWQIRTGFWPIEGLQASNKTIKMDVHFSYETPFGQWVVRNAVLLPSDKVLFQLGTDQICVFDPVTRRIALLWHGRGPVPVIEKTVPIHQGE